MAPTETAAAGELVENAAGRLVPRRINERASVPFCGVGAHLPQGNKVGPPIRRASDYPVLGDKRVGSLREALERCGLRDGMTIGTHHHFRNGDLVANAVFEEAAAMGCRDLRWFPSASFPCHEPQIAHLQSGVIHHIEGSMNGPLGDHCSRGKMRGMGVLRSHGGRWQAIQDGEVHVDVAVIAAPAADCFGNATGDRGPSACGLLGFALADSLYADHVIVVTDHLVPFPCLPWQIQGNNVDFVVEVDKVGEPEKIVSGTTRVTSSPDRLLIAEYCARFVRDTGILREGFSFQAGAGGTALAFGIFLKEMMQEAGVTAGFVRGGSNEYLVSMLEEGLTPVILDGQTFDLEGVRSMRENAGHQNTSPFTSYNFHGKGNFASMVDVVILGATEVDVGFNANVVTHTDGRLLHGIGGWQNCLFAGCTILAVPALRNRIPVVLDEVTTLCGPGELVDVIATERGLCINPARTDLVEAARGSSVPILDIAELKREVDAICGGPPDRARTSERVVAAIQWVDGTTIDCVRAVEG
ncbi:MAG: citrate lyase subunit alpha [Planctomycetota bacterium]|jgi:citrate lyase subunit alpha/citrate CoA-transferase|nr:citrate lyase subunit alpha [Planctomycetota bacterium]MDP6763531.1 citrate lyase subunit alpha [Planctomycetota bacterium]MDP6988150.1 citrate lyase subunit alpha [Planctomycetota bacterium]